MRIFKKRRRIDYVHSIICIHHCPEEFFIAGIKILASFLILCQASVPLTLAVFACVPLMGVVSVKLNQRLRARFRQQRVQIGELNATIADSLLGQGVVKACLLYTSYTTMIKDFPEI